MKYFGTEFGNTPAGLIHLSSAPKLSGLSWYPDARQIVLSVIQTAFWRHDHSFRWAVSYRHVEYIYGFNAGLPLWKGAHVTLSGSQQKLRGNVNGNVLVPLASQNAHLWQPILLSARLVERWIAAYPAVAPNRTDIDPRALNTNAPQSIDTDSSTVRLDQSLGDATGWQPDIPIRIRRCCLSVGARAESRHDDEVAHISRLTWNHVFSSRSDLDASTGFDRIHSLLVPEPNAVGPQVNIGTAYQPLGPNSGIPINRRDKQVSPRASSTAGRSAIISGRWVEKWTGFRTTASSLRANAGTTISEMISAGTRSLISGLGPRADIQSALVTVTGTFAGSNSSTSRATFGRYLRGCTINYGFVIRR